MWKEAFVEVVCTLWFCTVAHIHKLSEKSTLNTNTCERARVRWKKKPWQRGKNLLLPLLLLLLFPTIPCARTVWFTVWSAFCFRARVHSVYRTQRKRHTSSLSHTHIHFSFADVEVYSFSHLLSSQNKTQRFPMHYSSSVRVICFAPMIERFHNRDGHTACPKTIWLFFLYVPIFVRESHSHTLCLSFSV